MSGPTVEMAAQAAQFIGNMFGSSSGGTSLPGAQQLLGQGANLSGIGNQLASMGMNSVPTVANMGINANPGAFNAGSIASSVQSAVNPFSQMTANLDTQMNEPPGGVVTPNQAANNSQAQNQLQQAAQANPAWAATSNVLQELIKRQQQPIKVQPGQSRTAPSNAVPVNLGAAANPATTPALSSPLARYAMLLKGMQ